jgi:pimeloyl-ACP methyl ester carboxylesterase
MSLAETKLIDVGRSVQISVTISQADGDLQHDTPTLVFLHFWGGSSRTWSLVTPLLSGCATLSLDLRGWGHSTGPDLAEAYSIRSLADDVRTVITTLKLESVVLVGLSMGAKVAQVCAGAMRHPKIKGLVLLSPAPATPLSLPPHMREQQIHAYDHAKSAEFVARNVLTESFRGRELPGFVVEDMLRGNRWAREAWPAYSMAEDVSESLEDIHVPVLIIAAEKDQVEPLERIQREVAGRIGLAEVEVLVGSGHLSPVDAPQAVADHILRFLARL